MRIEHPITISLIVPIYGVERFIVEFADSVLGQSYEYIQFVFVNDGTKDNSMMLLEKVIEERYSHRKAQVVIINKQNGGLPAARQTGLEYATGDYVYHVDPDDWLSEDAIAKIAEKIEETNSDIVYFNYAKEYPNRTSIKRERSYRDAEKEQYIIDMYNHKAYGTLCNKCVRRSIYTENILYTPLYGYAEDCCLSVQLVGYASSISFLDEVLYHYRKGNSQAMTKQGLKKRKREYVENFLNLYEFFSNRPEATNPVKPIYDYIFLQAGWYSIIYKLNLFTRKSYLSQRIRQAKMRLCTDVWLGGQLFTKLVAILKS